MFGKRITAVFLTLCLLFTLLPQVARAEEGGGAIRLVSEEDPTGGIADGGHVYFGRTGGSAEDPGVCFRVLDAEHTNTGAAGMFLLSENLLGWIKFNENGSYNNYWKNSTAKNWCSGFFNGNLSSAEQAAVLAVTKSDGQFVFNDGDHYPTTFRADDNILNGERVFFLSAEEVCDPDYGFAGSGDRICPNNDSADPWWLRSGDWSHYYDAGIVIKDGSLCSVDAHINSAGARPALNLDPGAILLTSAAEGGKGSGTSGVTGVKPVPAYSGTDWKLTLKDPAHSSFHANLDSREGNTAEFYYWNAVTGENEYISVLIVNSAGGITYYGRLAQAASASGKVKADLDGKFGSGDKVYVFNEQINGDGKTDYASDLEWIWWYNAPRVSDAEISGLGTQTYTGEALTPVPVLNYQGSTLTLGTDFTVSYKNNTKAGTAAVTITGIGSYAGSCTKTFTIKPAPISKATVSALSAKTYTGTAIKQAPFVKFGGKTLKSGTDYTVSYKNNTNAGTATVTLAGKGNFTGTVSKTFKINPASIANAKLSGLKDQTYTGKALTPAPAVKLGTKTLKAGTDYTVSYKNNTKAGTATVTVTGKGNYTGKVTGSFTITEPEKPKDLVQEFVARLYRVCLDREPEAGGLAWWVERLKTKQETGGSCAWGFFDSTEFRNHRYGNSAFLDHAYKAFFDRRPDAAGKSYWLSEMKKGMTRKQVIAGFAASNEWKALCKQYGIKP